MYEVDILPLILWILDVLVVHRPLHCSFCLFDYAENMYNFNQF